MKELLIHLRAMQLFSHHAHNLVARTPFFADHDFFGSVYSELEGDYDSIIERIIGLQGENSLQLQPLLVEVSALLAQAPSVGVKENSIFFTYLLSKESELCSKIALVIKTGTSPGTEQLLGDICDRSEQRQYKIKQRIKK